MYSTWAAWSILLILPTSSNLDIELLALADTAFKQIVQVDQNSGVWALDVCELLGTFFGVNMGAVIFHSFIFLGI